MKTVDGTNSTIALNYISVGLLVAKSPFIVKIYWPGIWRDSMSPGLSISDFADSSDTMIRTHLGTIAMEDL